ncbi:MAG: PorV/PorQ family protein [Spirochaetes bacterium]|nr:PorV/PorQ family protein [Spirochaetota bacterium]
MRKYLNLLIITILVFSKANSMPATSSAADFLKVETSAKVNALGGAFVAITQGSATAIYNPAGLIFHKENILSFSGLPWIGGTMFSSVTYIEPIPKYPGITIGLDLTMFSTMEIREYSLTGEELGSTSLFDMSASFFISYPLIKDTLGVGAGIHFILRDLVDTSIFGAAFDIAIIYKTSFLSFYSPKDKNLTLGLALRNIGPPLSFDEFSSSEGSSGRMPSSLNIGFMYRFLKTDNSSLYFTAEFTSYFNEGDKRYKIGFSYSPFGFLSLRMGYQNGFELKSLSSGFGIKAGKITIDYAFIPLNSDIGFIHSFTASLNF